VDTLLQDLRYALRSLRKSPGFTTVAVLTLAIGIGANTAVFSLMSALFYRPLPFADPDRLAVIAKRFEASGNSQIYIDPPSFFDWTADTSIFEGAALVAGGSMNLSSEDQAEYVNGSQVSPGTFELLGIRPALGRSFVATDGTPGGENVVILSDALWRRQFGADSLVVGRQLRMNDFPVTVVGVMPRGFAFPYQAKFWTTQVFDPIQGRGNNWVNAVVRLREGVTVAQATAHLDVVSRRLEEQYPRSNAGVSASLAPLRRLILGGDPDELREFFFLMLGAVGFVLLIACANLANLLLTRATTRGREIAVRAALGASRRRLARQLLTESGLLGVGGGALGILVAAWGLAIFHAVVATRFEIPYWIVFTIDWRAVLFTAAVSLATGLAVGAAPALRTARSDLRASLQEGARAAGPGTRTSRLRSAFVIAEIALAMVLLVGAGLLIRTVLVLGRVDPGFDAAQSFTARVFLGGTQYDSTRVRGAFFNELVRRLEALPGVEAVGATNLLPVGSINWEGVQVERHDDSARTTLVTSVAGRYFEALGIPLVEGRTFTEMESERGGPVVIINETMRRRYWSRESPLGRRVRFGRDPAAPWHTVVGVSRDVKQGNLETGVQDQVYVPYAQRYSWQNMSVIVRSAGDPMRSVSMVRAELARIDPTVALYDVQPMEGVVRRSFREKALYSDMFTVFAGVGLMLAAIGIYGVMAYSVAQRTHEIGVRMALGAERGDVIGLVVRRGVALASAGVGVGVLAALALTRLLGSLLFGVSPLDLTTFAGTALLLAGVAVLASYLPARRAARVDPMVALRNE
jgi:putative ABC transport system permease protein